MSFSSFPSRSTLLACQSRLHSTRFVVSTLARPVCRYYASRPRHYREEALENRDLIYSVLSARPSKREARHFLKRLVPQAEPNVTSKKAHMHENQQDPVERLWRRTTHINALVLVPSSSNGSVNSNEYHKIIQVLLRLQRLGICPVVIIDDTIQCNDNDELLTNNDGETCENSREAACQLAEMIDTAGGRARPIWSDVLLWRDETGSRRRRKDHRNMTRIDDQVERLDANLASVKAAIALNQIPVIAPCAISMDGQWQRVAADAALVAIARQSACLAKDTLSFHKLILINEYGGLPRHALINIIDEADSIRASLSGPSKAAHCRTLWLAERALAYLPGTASALAIAAQHSPAILANVITEKPEWSPSLPEALKPMQAISPNALLNIDHHQQQQQHRLLTAPINYTVLRRGMTLRVCKQLDELDRSALFTLLEQSFGRKLMVEQYWQRLMHCHTGTIVAGDYQGAAIMTNESTNVNLPGATSMTYLDKFAVSPRSQGLGVADIVWHRMQQIYPIVTWRSRANNGVNGWYFDRADGHLRVSNTNWVAFWYDLLGNSVNPLAASEAIARAVPPSFQ
ncbi:hypothetical protein BDF22DRAFT_665116 [Syncephalis plumigaleata]|nr:hypothetical protein BDF22DRAFT_665116 [Syncephalis plumigaleata]